MPSAPRRGRVRRARRVPRSPLRRGVVRCVAPGVLLPRVGRRFGRLAAGANGRLDGRGGSFAPALGDAEDRYRPGVLAGSCSRRLRSPGWRRGGVCSGGCTRVLLPRVGRGFRRFVAVRAVVGTVAQTPAAPPSEDAVVDVFTPGEMSPAEAVPAAAGDALQDGWRGPSYGAGVHARCAGSMGETPMPRRGQEAPATPSSALSAASCKSVRGCAQTGFGSSPRVDRPPPLRLSVFSCK